MELTNTENGGSAAPDESGGELTDKDMNDLLMGRATQEQKNRIRVALQDENSFACRWIRSFRSAASNPFRISIKRMLDGAGDDE